MPKPNLDDQGRFRSSKHADLPVDRVRLNVTRSENWPGLLLVADAYHESDPEFSDALRHRITGLQADLGEITHPFIGERTDVPFIGDICQRPGCGWDREDHAPSAPR